MDEDDGDPARLASYVIEAVDRIEPGFAEGLQVLLRNPEADLAGVVLPRVVSAFASLRRELILVFEDYHLRERGLSFNPVACMLDHLPENVQLVISTRTESDIPVGRLRACGNLLEVRASDLCFGRNSVRTLLRLAGETELDDEDLDALVERTEGWPAAIYLATLALQRSSNPSADVRAFSGSVRHVADYLTEEVLERQTPRARRFLLRTSILDSFNASLGGAVADEKGAADILCHLERSNTFLTTLDERREWYRYHRLFADLLRIELKNTEPDIMPELHQRAAKWYRKAGDIEAAVKHTLSSGDYRETGELIVRNWLGFLHEGRTGTLLSWLSSMPEAAVREYAPLALVNAWLSAFKGDFAAFRRWTSVAENGSYEGPLPDGTASLESGVAVLRASYPFDGIQQGVDAGRRALELEPAPDSPWASLVRAARGYSLYWSGQTEDSRLLLKESLRLSEVSPTLPVTKIIATSYLSLIEAEDGSSARAERLARQALDQTSDHGLDDTHLAGTPHVTLGMVLASSGRPEEAVAEFERGIELVRPVGRNPAYPHALLASVPARLSLGDREGAWDAFDKACFLAEEYDNPAPLLTSMLNRIERKLRSKSRRIEPGQDLSEIEREVLGLLGHGLGRKEIADSLYLSVNTVKSHLRSIYRKLGVSSREAATEQARNRGLLQ
ncbi:MAG: LuxR C-terminal-related transcriptional regulator [Rubrobacter sp.]|nr:LuxR C-terminal-related transcriptional regulator [Rubrobacter sp.]